MYSLFIYAHKKFAPIDLLYQISIKHFWNPLKCQIRVMFLHGVALNSSCKLQG